MSATLHTVGRFMSGVNRAVKPYKPRKLRIVKAKKPKEDKKQQVSKERAVSSKQKGAKERASGARPTTSKAASGKQEPIWVESERVYPTKSATGSVSSSSPQSSINKPKPPRAKVATEKARIAKKGTKNLSTMKVVGRPSVDLVTGEKVYDVTDAPRPKGALKRSRQWSEYMGY